ncbi:MAG TPA: porin [Planctomycetaceae bacterium]|nr:porin [Planctomycetaceae bacterium]
MRRTTINRSGYAESSSPRKSGLYQQAQFQVASEDVRPEAPEEPQGNDVPPASQQSLEEQIIELRARLDSLTAASQNAPVMSQSTTGGSVPSSAFGGGAMGGSDPSTVQGSVFGSDATGAPTWVNEGLTFSSRDGEFKTHIGGLVQLDVLGFGSPNNLISPGGAGTQEAVEFRRLRMRFDGTMYKTIDWVFESDFALALQNTDQLSAAAPITGLRSFPTGVGAQGGNTTNVMQPTTIFMTFKEIPILGNVRVGNQQDWFSMEHIESARFLDFMERSPMMDAFSGPNNNGYTPGISAFNNTSDMRAGAQIGIYKNNAYDSGFTYSIGDAWTYGGRIIWSPYYDEESKGRYMVHTGFGTEYRTFNDNPSPSAAFENIRVRSRGDLRNAASTLDPNYVDTGNFYATSQTLINPELAIVYGPLLIQGEYIASWMNGAFPAKNVNTSLGTVFFEGGYLQALYFLTGENRVYNRQQGVFNRVIPKETFNLSKGTWGAWQLGVRYDTLDLNSGTYVNGGNASDMTFGINWFLNGNARFQFNYVLSWVNNAPPVTFPGTVGALNGARFVGDGSISSFGARMDFNF